MVQKKKKRAEHEHARSERAREATAGIRPSSSDPEIVEQAEPARSGAVRSGIETGREQRQPTRNPITRAARRVGNALKQAKNRLTNHRTETPVVAAAEATPKTVPAPARVPRRDTDIPMDEIARTYTPMQTSLKASFRSDGGDQQRDQEYANGAADNHWNDEDRYTNHSGDPRIGTHRRTYEAGEKRNPEEE